MYTYLAVVESGSAIIGNSLMTGLILLVVVFAALVALALVIQMFGKIGATEKEAPKPVTPPAPKAQKAVAVPTAVSAPTEDEDEIAAVIAAAVAMMAPAGVTYRVRRITPAGVRARSEWATAAVRQNTMPF